jgi:GT2 family glycosyltransferase
VTKPSNTGYLDSTNIGATYARGEYLLLLNNDTEPTNGWLDALVETIDSDITIGAVGSKLIYSNGFMQEAGAQVFNDGSAWNLGRHVTSLFDGSISSIREVDYCSAACLLIRKKTWDELEGFDRRFAPAYYEDTDLCMRIWNNGERVVYQPNSLVIHHEGLSHGRNEFTGLKAHQQKNKITFFQKWENTLESHWSAELAPRLEYRRDSRGIVVIIDSQLPSDLRDSGSQRTFALIKSLQDLGFHVILGALDSSTTPGSIYGLRMNGVEVHYLIEDLINSLESRKHRLRLFWLIRENVITSLELKLKSKFSSIEIIADLLDLDFKVTGNGEFIISASQMKIINNYKKVVLVSPLEVQLAKEKSKSSSIFPIWTEFETQHIPSLPKKNNFLFIGGFRHPPNVEAIDWLIHEIVPEFRLLNSETPISIIGSGLDGYRVALLNSLGINYLGTIQDLKSAYASAVASLAPLKSGRGLKGKIGEAMSYGVPVIGTSISFDGFQIQNRVNALIADDAKSFAELMNELVKNQEFRSELSLEALNWHKNFYGPGTLKGQIRTLLDTP